MEGEYYTIDYRVGTSKARVNILHEQFHLWKEQTDAGRYVRRNKSHYIWCNRLNVAIVRRQKAVLSIQFQITKVE